MTRIAFGVLRQVGPVYQFRHAALQDRLAGGGIVVREAWWTPLRCAACRATHAPWAASCPGCGRQVQDARRTPRPEPIPAAGGWLLVRATWTLWWLVSPGIVTRFMESWLAPAVLGGAFVVVYLSVGIAVILVRPRASPVGVAAVAFASALAVSVIVVLVMGRRRPRSR